MLTPSRVRVLWRRSLQAVSRGGFGFDPPVDEDVLPGDDADGGGGAPEHHRLIDADAVAAPAAEQMPVDLPEPADYGWRGSRRAAHAGVRPYAPKTTVAHCLAHGEFTRVAAVAFQLDGYGAADLDRAGCKSPLL